MSVKIVTVFVPGQSVPQGSLQSGGRGNLFYSNAATLKPWRRKIADTVSAALPEEYEPTAGPIELTCLFVFKRPKTGPNSDPSLTYHIIPPDRDKLLRAVQDALTGVVYIDDAQVSFGKEAKVYVGAFGTTEPGLLLSVARL